MRMSRVTWTKQLKKCCDENLHNDEIASEQRESLREMIDETKNTESDNWLNRFNMVTKGDEISAIQHDLPVNGDTCIFYGLKL